MLALSLSLFGLVSKCIKFFSFFLNMAEKRKADNNGNDTPTKAQKTEKVALITGITGQGAQMQNYIFFPFLLFLKIAIQKKKSKHPKNI